MVKRWSMTLIGKIFFIRDTIEQSVFYIALALILRFRQCRGRSRRPPDWRT